MRVGGADGDGACDGGSVVADGLVGVRGIDWGVDFSLVLLMLIRCNRGIRL